MKKNSEGREITVWANGAGSLQFLKIIERLGLRFDPCVSRGSASPGPNASVTERKSGVKEEESRFYALVPASGVGRRMGLAVPKQYLRLAGETVLSLTVRALHDSGIFSGILVVVSETDAWIDEETFPEGVSVVRRGGETRADTVVNGLETLSGGAVFPASGSDWVMVHDAARPFVDPADIRKLRDEVLSAGHGAILAMPMADTVKEASPDRRILATRDRKSLWRAATPQAFRLSELLSALRRGTEGVTDESSAMERTGHPVSVVPGSTLNFKITTPDDALIAEAIAESRLRKHP
jgi:2-C-methyl-D-erythritol 4-phosphate cytidylyltransferase